MLFAEWAARKKKWKNKKVRWCTGRPLDPLLSMPGNSAAITWSRVFVSWFVS
jgi:hypothetical protein